jgi:asparaginyl-tRNA synthetase
VSGQLAAETHACALGDVYTFGPTFRAEDSNTARHLAEFWMIEPEMAFTDLHGDMDNAEAYVKHVVGHVLERSAEDMAFFGQFVDKGLPARLEALIREPFARVRYADAVEMLRDEIADDPSKWEFAEVSFGTDLATEHERWLAEKAFGRPTFVYDYPKEIKAFYMRDNEDGKTVAAMDLLVPGVGELIGGSQREERLEVLVEKMLGHGLDPEEYSWYLDLRRYGSVPHAGYGLGFERLVCYVTGVANIRDAVAFPRYPGSCEF